MASVGQFKGNEKCQLVMEAICDGELWLWHVYFGHLGSMKDINIVYSSLTMGRILSRQFYLRINYVIIGKTSNLPSWLGDEMYFRWPTFVNRIRKASSEKGNQFRSK